MNSMNSVELARSFEGRISDLKSEVSKVIVGQEQTVEALINALFCHGHVLMVGVPGLAKTLLVKTISTVWIWISIECNLLQI